MGAVQGWVGLGRTMPLAWRVKQNRNNRKTIKMEPKDISKNFQICQNKTMRKNGNHLAQREHAEAIPKSFNINKIVNEQQKKIK